MLFWLKKVGEPKPEVEDTRPTKSTSKSKSPKKTEKPKSTKKKGKHPEEAEDGPKYLFSDL